MALYKKSEYEADLELIERLGQRLSGMVAERKMTGHQLLRGEAILEGMRQECKRQLNRTRFILQESESVKQFIARFGIHPVSKQPVQPKVARTREQSNAELSSFLEGV